MLTAKKKRYFFKVFICNSLLTTNTLGGDVCFLSNPANHTRLLPLFCFFGASVWRAPKEQIGGSQVPVNHSGEGSIGPKLFTTNAGATTSYTRPVFPGV